MKFTETPLSGAYLIEPERLEDHRGFFARTFCQREFAGHGLHTQICQSDISYNHREGTLRGLHFQSSPYTQVKLVKCISGAIYDVIVDLRPASPTFAKWHAAELSADNRAMFYVPEGFAHGYQVLKPGSEVLYQMFEFYKPGADAGVRWDDPHLAIPWPLPQPIMSSRDRALPFVDDLFGVR